MPCLATLAPAPAAIKAAVVEILKVPERSPPVPAVSTTGSPIETETATARMVSTNPAISSAVSPLIRSEIMKADV